MTTYSIVGPKAIDTTVKLPASKSISNRALIIRALSEKDVTLENVSDCDDTEVMVRALMGLPEIIDIRAAGTSMRFLTALLSATEHGTHLITGTERMLHRPIGLLVDALRFIGASIDYVGVEGYPPLRIHGQRLPGGPVEMAGNVSSQYISALLLIGPLLRDGLQLRLKGSITSRPYIDLTLWMMREFGAVADWSSVDSISVEPKPYTRTSSYYIESDWSAASYWYELLALSANSGDRVRLEGLTDGSKQGDSAVRYLFSLLGVHTSFASRKPGRPTTVTLKKSGHHVSRLDYDFTGQPDLAQTLVVCCAMMGVPFHFTGLQTLKIKETDRIEALKREMRKLGYVVVSDAEGYELTWDGERCMPERGAAIDTYNDHRMAMAFAPVCMRQAVSINDPEVVSKSYPRFWDDLRQAGARVEWREERE